MQQFLKPAGRSADAGVVATEFLDEFLHAVDHSVTALDLGFRRESLPALTGYLESIDSRSDLIS
jgi:hypothetical protein